MYFLVGNMNFHINLPTDVTNLYFVSLKEYDERDGVAIKLINVKRVAFAE